MLQRELSVTYGLTTVGGLSVGYQIPGRIKLTTGYAESIVEFPVLVTATTEAAFGTLCTALEAAFRKPWQPLTVVQGSRLLAKYKAPPTHKAYPEIEKSGEDVDTGRSRLYTVRIRISMPADNVKPGGLRNGTIDVRYSASGRRTVVASGTWTAIGSSGARDAFLSGIDAYVQAALTALGGTYELAERTREQIDENLHLIEFSRRYEEIIYPQGGASLDDPEIVEQTLNVSRRQEAPGDSRDVPGTGAGAPSGRNNAGTATTTPTKRLTIFDLSYSANIQTGVDLKRKYESIRSWLLDQITGIADTSDIALVVEEPRYDNVQSRIEVTMQALAATGGKNKTFERSITITDDVDEDQKFVPAWTGKPFSRYVYEGPRSFIRTVSVNEKRVLGTGKVAVDAARNYIRTLWSGGISGVAGAQGGSWSRGQVTANVANVYMGTDDNGFNTVTIVGSIRREYFESIKGAGSK